MIDLEHIENKPILILSSPRTGSTMLADSIAEKTGRRFFNEPAQKTITFHKFLIYDNRQKNYVLKEHTLTFLQKYTDYINQPLYKIRIRRRNLIDQVISNYIAVNRKQWLFNEGETITDTIKLDKGYLNDSLEFIKRFNKETDLFEHKIDLDLYYEDLNIPNSTTIPTPKPLNHKELTEWAYDILRDNI